MTMEKKIAAINNYNEFVGSCIRYEENGGNFYRINDIETGDDFDRVSEKHIKEAYEEALENLDKLYESFLGIEK